MGFAAIMLLHITEEFILPVENGHAFSLSSRIVDARRLAFSQS